MADGRSPPSGGGTAGSLKEKVDKIKEGLELDAALPIPAAIKQANELMELPNTGSLPAQAAALIEAIGL